jgi:hypothetical protein
VLEGIGRTQMVPIAYEGSILVLRHSMPSIAKIKIGHSLEVSKKRSQSISDTYLDFASVSPAKTLFFTLEPKTSAFFI